MKKVSKNTSMKLFVKSILWISCLFVFSSSSSAQIYLQLERANNPKSLKFYEDQILEFKLNAYPKTWRYETILAIKPDANTLVFEDNFYNINEIHSIRLRQQWATSIGTNLLYASAAWFTYGTIASLTSGSDGYKMSSDEILIGVGAATIGYFMRTVLSKKKIKLNKNRRLRIMDIRMFTN